ncbi:hypothetical protein [Streptomyces sp. MMS20-AI2-20]|uniref:hypothetical protein n=1 Tax=Streptomyces sp. MMS20-AI2-20 TaxID=2925835 RepID=UPI0035AF53BE
MRDLERVEALRLSLALALLGRPRLLGIDDADLKLSAAEREEVWTLLRSVSGTGVTVLAVCSEPPPGAVVVRTGAERAGGPETEGAAPTGDGPGRSPAYPDGDEPHDSPAPATRSAATRRPPGRTADPDRTAGPHDEKEADDDAIAATGRS